MNAHQRRVERRHLLRWLLVPVNAQLVQTFDNFERYVKQVRSELRDSTLLRRK